ncbi:MAG: glycosyltransferase family 39 protein [Deltaproteobacteria bacterium]|nr:glycosyltransferase family 39 protein [Deltaproteobacteria bacterium]
MKKEFLLSAVGLTITLLAIRLFFDAAAAYNYFTIPSGVGVNRIPPDELVYFGWYLFLGAVGVAGLSIAVYQSKATVVVSQTLEKIVARPWIFVCTIALIAFIATLCARYWVLLEAPVADDESTYLFIAKTLMQGRIVNAPPDDPDFYRNQFVVLSDHGWYGKYPLGFPLLLAGALFTGTLLFLGPFFAACTVVLTYLIAKRLTDVKIACLSVGLLVISPHFVFTFATLLSQVGSTTFTLLGILLFFQLQETRRWYFALLAGIVWGTAVLIRPLPCALFLLISAAAFVIPPRTVSILQHLKANWLNLIFALIPIALVAVVFFLVNRIQTGDVLRSGYHVVHGETLGIAADTSWQTGMSVAASLWRQNFWLFGWPVSILFLFFIRQHKRFFLIWGMIAAVYVYRIVAPKAVVSTTGPLYVTEIVPMLALLSAEGLRSFCDWISSVGKHNGKRLGISIVTAATAISFVCFWPIQIDSIHRGASEWTAVYRTLENRGISKALVFANAFVPPLSRKSWAYFPPNMSPDGSDDIAVMRIPGTMEEAVPPMIDFWRRKYSDRPAFVYINTGEGMTLVPIEEIEKMWNAIEKRASHSDTSSTSTSLMGGQTN